MSSQVTAYEARLVGWPPVAAAAGTAVVAAVLVLAAAVSNAPPSTVDSDLTGVVEAALPLAGAVGAIWSVLGDRALELQLSLPRSYRAVVAKRMALALVPTAILAVASVAWMCLAGRAPGGHGLVAGQLVWLCPLSALCGVGLALAVGTGSPVVGVGAVAVAWLWQQIQRDDFAKHPFIRPFFLFQTTYQPHASGWAADRVTLAAVAAVGLVAAWIALSRPDRLLKEDA